MESYGERRVTVYDVIFGELRFLDGHITKISELNQKPNLGQSAVNSNSPILESYPYFYVYRMFFKFTACFTECLLFLCRFNLLVYSHA